MTLFNSFNISDEYLTHNFGSRRDVNSYSTIFPNSRQLVRPKHEILSVCYFYYFIQYLPKVAEVTTRWRICAINSLYSCYPEITGVTD